MTDNQMYSLWKHMLHTLSTRVNFILFHAIYLLLAGSHLKNSFVSTQFFFAVNGENLFQKTLLPPLTIKYIGLHSLKSFYRC